MGYDISVHAVDPALVTDTFVPAVLGEEPPGLASFIDRAARLAAVAARAHDWGRRVHDLDVLIDEKQLEVGPKRMIRRPKRFGALRRLVGGAAYNEISVAPQTSGIPGFDPDLCLWGRPFLIVADAAPEAVDAVEAYLRLGEPETVDLDAVDALARSMVERLDARRDRLPPGLAPEVADVVGAFVPLLDHLRTAPYTDFDAEAARRRQLTEAVGLFRQAWARRGTDARLGDETAADLVLDLPLALVGLAAFALPGWMGRGYTWPTTLLPEAGVTVSDVFEPPTSLFAPLVEAYPPLAGRFDDTIMDHGRLGGYVRPERVPELRARIEAHEAGVVAVFGTDERAGAAAYSKLLEPVVLAERRGYGVIEAEGVYSGFMGITN